LSGSSSPSAPAHVEAAAATSSFGPAEATLASDKNMMGFLTNYRTRLETMSETESTAVAVREVYSAYYSELGGVGAAPEPKARTAKTEG
jgi:hypothetical protein